MSVSENGEAWTQICLSVSLSAPDFMIDVSVTPEQT